MKKFYVLIIVSIAMSASITSQGREWEWAKTAIQPDNAHASAVVKGVSTDALGNVFAAGYFYTDSISFGNYTLLNAGVAGYTENIFVVKYDAAGNVMWARAAGGTKFDFAAGVKTDLWGNVYVSGGFFSDSISFDGRMLYNYGPTDTTCDGFIAKYDPNGNIQWARSFGGDYYDGSDAVATDLSGNVYVAGYFQSDSITIGNYTLHDAGGVRYHNGLLIKYDSAGNVLWAAASQSASGGVEEYAVATDAQRNVFVAGRFGGATTQFGQQLIQNQRAGYNDIFITKYDSAGNALWAQDAGGSLSDLANGIATDGEGNCYVTGYFNSGIAYFGPGQVNNDTTDGTGDLFMAKYDTAGNLIWVKGFGGPQNDVGTAVTVDTGGNTFVTGYYYSAQMILGNDTLKNFANTGTTDDLFIAGFDKQGNVLSTISVGGLSYEGGYGIAADGNNNIYIGGFFRSDDVVFGATTLNNSTATHTTNPVVAKYVSISTGVGTIKPAAEIKLYPNPVADRLVAQSATFASGVAVCVYDATGKKIKLNYTLEGDKIAFNTRPLAAGMYIIKVDTNVEQVVAKFVKEVE